MPHRAAPLRNLRASCPRANPPQKSAPSFVAVEALGGLVLLVAAACALAWANSPWSASYVHLWHRPLAPPLGLVPEATVGFWIDDGLMTLFFLVVGLELHREMRSGVLADRRLALLPAVAAAGGMIAPALVYLAIDHGSRLRPGWAVPVPTDIAFAVGVLALLGARVPQALRAQLLALAIIDDLGAVIVIALAYSHGISVAGILAAAAAVAATLLLRRAGLDWKIVYVAAGVVVWGGLLRAGVHPALAGVVLGFLVPLPATDPTRSRLEEALHPWVAYGVMPLFALANAGVEIGGIAWRDPLQSRLVAGVGVALLLGKPLGILLASLGAVRLGLCELPRGIGVRGLAVVGALGGIGFTMSIFIARLAFAEEPLLAAAKLGTLVGSSCAALVGLTLGLLLLPRPDRLARSATCRE